MFVLYLTLEFNPPYGIKWYTFRVESLFYITEELFIQVTYSLIVLVENLYK